MNQGVSVGGEAGGTGGTMLSHCCHPEELSVAMLEGSREHSRALFKNAIPFSRSFASAQDDIPQDDALKPPANQPQPRVLREALRRPWRSYPG